MLHRFNPSAKTFSLAGRAGLVTTSSKSTGFAIAHGLREAGAEVVLHGNTSQPADLPADSAFVAGNLLDPETPAALVVDERAEAVPLEEDHVV